MSENRGEIRRRTLKSGKIVFNGGASVIDCTIRDLSQSGARLLVESVLGIPDQFTLEAMGREPLACTVVWRLASSVGVSFLA
jgi:hypothetical protein